MLLMFQCSNIVKYFFLVFLQTWTPLLNPASFIEAPVAYSPPDETATSEDYFADDDESSFIAAPVTYNQPDETTNSEDYFAEDETSFLDVSLQDLLVETFNEEFWDRSASSIFREAAVVEGHPRHSEEDRRLIENDRFFNEDYVPEENFDDGEEYISFEEQARRVAEYDRRYNEQLYEDYEIGNWQRLMDGDHAFLELTVDDPSNMDIYLQYHDSANFSITRRTSSIYRQLNGSPFSELTFQLSYNSFDDRTTWLMPWNQQESLTLSDSDEEQAISMTLSSRSPTPSVCSYSEEDDSFPSPSQFTIETIPESAEESL
jgi:hypothetical protein